MNETLADILAEMRTHGRGKVEDAWYTPDDWRDLCDRIEAAAERDKRDAMKTALMAKCEICAQLAPQFNAAALREALEAARHTIRRWQDDLPVSALEEVETCIQRINLALAALARSPRPPATATGSIVHGARNESSGAHSATPTAIPRQAVTMPHIGHCLSTGSSPRKEARSER